MKKLLFALTIACSVFTMTAFASDVKVSAKVLAAFEHAFEKASNVKWAQVRDLYQADFKIEDQKYSAYFDADGQMIVVARFVTEEQLPHFLKSSLQQQAGDGKVAYVFELSDDEGVHYYATIEKGDKKQMLQSMGSKKWVPYNKIKLQ